MLKIGFKAKMTLLIPALVAGIMLLMVMVYHKYLESSVKAIITEQQDAFVDTLADEFDNELQRTQNEIISIAGKITAEYLASPAKAEKIIRKNIELGKKFDNGLVLLDEKGMMLAEAPPQSGPPRRDFASEQYFKDTVTSGQPRISDPYQSSKRDGHPVIMFTVPLFDLHHNLAGVLAGSVDLTGINFLGKLKKTKISPNGYLFLFSHDRTLILHSNNSLLLKDKIPTGANPLLDRAIAGFEGTGETVNSDGIRTLSTFRQLKLKNWILGANYPTAEAYRVLNKAQTGLLLGILPVFLICGLAVRLIMSRFTEPLLRITAHVRDLAHKEGADRFYRQRSGDELDTLSDAFNDMIIELEQQRGQLLKSKEMYQMVADFATDMIVWITPQREILYISPSSEKLTGYADTDFYRNSSLLDEMVAPQDRERWREHKAISLQPCCGDGIELRIITKSGELRWVSHHCRVVFDDNGTLKGVRGSFSDVTERKQAELALLKREELLIALNETAIGLLSRLELDSLLESIIHRAGTLMNTIHGYIYLVDEANNELINYFSSGVFASFLHHPLHRGEGLAGKVWQGGEPLTVDMYCDWQGRLSEPGRDVLRAIVGVPLKSAERIAGVIGLAYIEGNRCFSVEDVEILSRFAELASIALDNAQLYATVQKELKERKKVEEQLRTLTHAVEQSPVSIVITDTYGTIEYVNRKFTDLTGYTVDESVGENPRFLKTGTTTDAEYQELWNAISSGREWRGEFQNRKKNGEIYWEFASISPVINRVGVITHYIAIKEDITERKKLETHLLHSQKMESIGLLAGGIAHDFNNILTAIIGYASLIQMKLEDGSPLLAVLEQLVKAANRASKLTQGLLAFSRQQISNPVLLDLNDCVARVEKLLSGVIDENIKLQINVSGDRLVVMADSIQLEQIIVNLAANSRDAMPQGGHLSISTERQTLNSDFVLKHGFGASGTYAVLKISDTGHGIAAENVKRIFEPFFTTKAVGRGTGLGLSIVYGIIKTHSGFISCESAPGKGACFSIFLPLYEESVPQGDSGPKEVSG